MTYYKCLDCGNKFSNPIIIPDKAQQEAAQVAAQGRPGDGPATVLLEMLGL